jgi:hypothetical protein
MLKFDVFCEASSQAKVVDPASAGLDTPAQPFTLCFFDLDGHFF